MAIAASPLLAFAAMSSSPASGSSLSAISVTVSSTDNKRVILVDPNNNVVGDTASSPNNTYPYPNADGTYSATALWGTLTNSPLGTYTIISTNQSGAGCDVGSTLSACQYAISQGTGYSNTATFVLVQGAATVPTVASSDIAAVGGPILGSMVSNSEYVLETFGPPLFVLLLVFAVFFAIYHRVKVGRWL